MTQKIKRAACDFWSDVFRMKWIILAVAVYCVGTQLAFGIMCPFKLLTGADCPGCGLTRGSLCVLSGQWSRAISYNATSFAWVGLILWLLWQRYIAAKSKIAWEFPVILVSLGSVFIWMLHIYEKLLV
jgi:hypothetical protein